MDIKQKKTIRFYMRTLHRDIGFFVVGITINYSLSGIVLGYRDTDFLKKEIEIEKTLPAGLDASALSLSLRLKNLKIIQENEEVINFQSGRYNKQSGVVVYTDKKLPSMLTKFIDLHKSVSSSPKHLPAILYGILVLFLSVSSFWMFKPKTKYFHRGIIIAGLGLVTAIILVLV